MSDGKPAEGGDAPASRAPSKVAMAAIYKALAHEKRLQLLSFLAEPRYIEEVASELGVARQTAEKHMHHLLVAGVVRRQASRRDTGRVVEYVLVPQRLFVGAEGLLALGAPRPRPEDDSALVLRTEPAPTGGRAGEPPAPLGLRAGSPAFLPGPPRLVLVHGRGVGRIFRLPAATPYFVIGRDAEAAISLDYDPYLSYRHAEIARGPRGLEIMDALSTNGTQVNGRLLGRGERTVLRHGDVLGVGHTLLLFREDA